MLRHRRAWVFILVSAVIAQGSVPALSQVSGPDRLLVVFRTETLPADASDIVRRAGGTIVDVIPEIGVVVAEAIGVNTDTVVSRLRRQPSIVAVGPDKVVTQSGLVAEVVDSVVSEGHQAHPGPFPPGVPTPPPDFFYTTPQQWAVRRIGAQGGGVPGSTGPGAWDVTFGSGVKVAVLDTGVSPHHPDTAPNLIFNDSMVSPSLCDDGSPIDQSGHGTWTASLAAGAKGPATGLIIGVAPEAQILNIKVLRREPFSGSLPPSLDNPTDRCRLGAGAGLSSGVLAGIVLAVQQGADIISMSLGEVVDRTTPDGLALWVAYARAVNHAVAAGVVVVASGSERSSGGTNVNNAGPIVHLPSDAPNALAVVATTNPDLPPPTPRQGCEPSGDCLAFYTDFGSRLRALAAPGGDLPSVACRAVVGVGLVCAPTGFVPAACSPGLPGTSPGLPMGSPPMSFGCFGLSLASQHLWYVQTSGTSASAALVAGAAALVKAANPRLTPSQIRTILQQTASDIGKVGYDGLFNFGLVNACRAVAVASNTPIDCP